MSNVFAGGNSIITRLTQEVTSLASVWWASASIGPNADQIALPAAFIQPGQAQGDDDPHESDVTTERQTWQIGLRVEVDPSATATTAAEVTLGTLIYDVIVALRGLQFANKAKLSYIARTETQYPAGTGVAEIWLTFQAVVLTRRT